jgi:hypothetical protein
MPYYNRTLTFGLNEKRPVVTSVIEVDRPFFTVDKVDSIVLDLLIREEGLLFIFVSLIEDCDCC